MRRDLPLRSLSVRSVSVQSGPCRHRVLAGVCPPVLHVQWCPAGSH